MSLLPTAPLLAPLNFFLFFRLLVIPNMSTQSAWRPEMVVGATARVQSSFPSPALPPCSLQRSHWVSTSWSAPSHQARCGQRGEEGPSCWPFATEFCNYGVICKWLQVTGSLWHVMSAAASCRVQLGDQEQYQRVLSYNVRGREASLKMQNCLPNTYTRSTSTVLYTQLVDDTARR